MVKGTPSMGKRQKKVHVKCRRCGSKSYNYRRRVCVACGFGQTSRMRHYRWKR